MKWQIFLDNLVKNNICTSKNIGIPYLKEEKNNLIWMITLSVIASIIGFFLKFNNEIINYVIILGITFLLTYGIKIILKQNQNTLYIVSYSYIAAIFTLANTNTFLDLILYMMGYHLGFLLIFFLFDSLKHKFLKSQIPKYIEGLPIILVTLSIIALLIGRYF